MSNYDQIILVLILYYIVVMDGNDLDQKDILISSLQKEIEQLS